MSSGRQSVSFFRWRASIMGMITSSQDLWSYAAVTDEPPPEIAATGHQRCIIALRDENVREWLSPQNVSRERLESILSDREAPYYEHRIAA